MKRTRIALHLCLKGLPFLALGFGLSVQAATTNVTIENFDFSPPNVSIKANDSVIWTWTGNSHTTTSPGVWDSGIRNAGASFTNIFTSIGTFPYLCSVHTFMVGSVAVVGANQPPSVTITNPLAGAVFAAPWSGVIQAAASDQDGTVTKVEFFTNSVSIGSVTSPPFSLPVTNLPAASYVLTAVATDNTAAPNSSSPVSISVVTPVPIVISDPLSISPTSFRMTYTANSGLKYVIERSPSLTNFMGVLTNTATSGSVNFTDNVATGPQNFYRVGRLPNP